MHGEREDSFAERNGREEGGRRREEGGEGELLVEGLGVVDHGGDALLLEPGLEGVALLTGGEAEGVLGPTGGEALRDDRGADALDITEEVGVAGGDAVDGIELGVTEGAELDLEDGSLESVEARVESDTHIVVLLGALAVDTVGVGELGPVVIVGEEGTAVAIAAEGLGGEEGGGGDVAKRTGTTAVDGTAEALGTVLEDEEAMLVGNAAQLGIVGGQAKQVDGDDDTGDEDAVGNDGLDSSLEGGGGDVERGFVYIDEYGGGTFEGDNLGGGKEGEVGHEDGIALADAPDLQGEGEGIGAVGTGDTVAYADVLGELGLEFLDGLAHDEGTGLHHTEHGAVDVGF